MKTTQEKLEKEISTLTEKLEMIKSLPPEPEWDIVYFKRKYRSGRTYPYVAIRGDDNMWHITGKSHYAYTWESLLTQLVEGGTLIGKIWALTEMEALT